ncbi:MAG: type III-B CRISPR-associated protein Cas10/Cmr2 [Ignavibacteria bacterium]
MSKNQSLLLFTIGPVQSFIAASRKTQDLFTGSMILSEIAGEAIKSVINDNGDIIFPYVSGKGDLDDRMLLASIPNRFLAKVPTEKATWIAQRAEKRLIDKESSTGFIHEMVNMSKGNIDNGEDFKNHPLWNLEWQNQTNAYWEVYWTILDMPDDNITENEYGKYYIDLENYSGCRKTIRNFNPLIQSGIKCGTFLNYSAVFPLNHGKYKNSRDFTKNYLAKKYPGKYKPGESLSSLAIVKREMAERYTKESFPSTVNLANGKFNESVIDKASADEQYHILVSNYLEEYKKLNEKLKTTKSSNYPILLEKAKNDKVLVEFLKTDNQFLFEEFTMPQALEKEYDVKIASDELSGFVSARRELLKAGNEKPSKYYAVFYFDGDKMGEWLSGSTKNNAGKLFRVTPDIHRNISRALREFSINTVPDAVEKRKTGKLVFAGGDDVIAFTTVQALWDIIAEVRLRFGRAMGEVTGNFAPATGSCGIAVAHYGQALQDVLTEARSAEKYAKDKLGRDAFAISIIKHSGERTITGAKFSEEAGYIALIKTFTKAIEEESLSGSFIYQVESEIIPMLDAGGEKNTEEGKAAPKAENIEEIKAVISSIIKFTLKRQTETMPNKNKELTEKLKKDLLKMVMSTKNATGIIELTALLKSAQFLMRGGD